MQFKMLSAICFNLDQSEILSSRNGIGHYGDELKSLLHEHTFTMWLKGQYRVIQIGQSLIDKFRIHRVIRSIYMYL